MSLNKLFSGIRTKETKAGAAIAQAFRQFCLPRHIADTVEKFLYFKMQEPDEKNPVPNNILIQYDDRKKADEFCNCLANAIRRVTDDAVKIGKTTEKKFLNDVLTGEICRNYNVVIIDEFSGTAMEEWVNRIPQLEESPAVTKIVLAPTQAAEQQMKDNPHLYYRVLSEHIQIGEYTAEDSCYSLINGLEDDGYKLTEEFRSGIKAYIDTVFPTAELLREKDGYAFTEDVRNRVLRKQQSRANSKKKRIDESCVPDYNKNKTVTVDDAPAADVPGDVNTLLNDISDMSEINSLSASVSTPESASESGTDSSTSAGNRVTRKILLTALSTFSYDKEKKEYRINRSEYTYNTGGKQTQFSGYYQLDPLPQYLHDTGEYIDSCILIVTEKAKKEVKATVKTDGKERSYLCSPLSYFKARLERWFGLTEENINIVEVDEDKDDPATAVTKATEYLSDISQSSEVKLYVDSHGGFRDVNLIFSAIITLLPRDKFHVRPFSVKIDGHSGRLFNDRSMRIFDFVSGINEFINYGRIDSLLRFLDKNENASLLNPISKISDGILACNIKSFNEGIDDLRSYFQKTDGSEITDPYLKLFRNRIQEDYGKLLDEKATARIKANWCIRKGFDQQALTILESHVPDDLFSKGIIINNYRGKIRNITDKEIFDGSVVRFSWSYSYWEGRNIKGKNKGKDDTSNADGLIKLFDRLESPECSSEDSIADYLACKITRLHGNSVGGEFDKLDTQILQTAQASEVLTKKEVPAADGITEKKDKKGNKIGYQFDNAIRFNLKDENQKRHFILFLSLHRSLKCMRNNSNHGDNATPYAPETMKGFLKYYLYVLGQIGLE